MIMMMMTIIMTGGGGGGSGLTPVPLRVLFLFHARTKGAFIKLNNINRPFDLFTKTPLTDGSFAIEIKLCTRNSYTRCRLLKFEELNMEKYKTLLLLIFRQTYFCRSASLSTVEIYFINYSPSRIRKIAVSNLLKNKF